jgi:hypothetical protein
MKPNAWRHSVRPPRGSVIIIVLWAISIAAIVTASVQLFSHRQATLGRETLERVQARWAARAGVEHAMAVMTDLTSRPYDDDAKALFRELSYVYAGDTINASYSVYHQIDGKNIAGPMDEHAKINVNRIAVDNDRALLMVLDDMTVDVLEAIGDWLDADDDASILGAERDYYLGLETPYSPRNSFMHSIGEMELIGGVWPKYFRGEDWNMDNRVDPNENDGARSFPPDNADGILDGGWLSHLTVYSTINGANASGQPRLRLKDATIKELRERLGVDERQAQALIDFGKVGTNQLTDLLFTPLGMSGNQNQTGQNQNQSGQNQQRQPNNNNNDNNNRNRNAQDQNQVRPLDDDQLRMVLAETCIEDPVDRLPGKMNLNTVSQDLLRDLISLMGLDDAIADEIIHMRNSRPQGIVSLADLKKIPNVTSDDLKAITRRFDTVSNVFTISSRGRASASGLEVEIVAVVDRSTVPVRILEYREQ